MSGSSGRLEASERLRLSFGWLLLFMFMFHWLVQPPTGAAVSCCWSPRGARLGCSLELTGGDRFGWPARRAGCWLVLLLASGEGQTNVWAPRADHFKRLLEPAATC